MNYMYNKVTQTLLFAVGVLYAGMMVGSSDYPRNLINNTSETIYYSFSETNKSGGLKSIALTPQSMEGKTTEIVDTQKFPILKKKDATSFVTLFVSSDKEALESVLGLSRTSPTDAQKKLVTSKLVPELKKKSCATFTEKSFITFTVKKTSKASTTVLGSKPLSISITDKRVCW